MPYGKFWGIGVGPGDPELLTLKAKRILEEVDLLFIPRSRSEKRSLAFSIVSGVIEKDWQIIDLILPMTRDKEELRQHWQAAAAKVIEVLQKGQDAAFITLGDPTLFSTFPYLFKEVQKMAPEIEVEIIPGISSVTSISAWIKEALVEGEESLLIIPAEEKHQHLESYLEHFENIMIMKAGRYIEYIHDVLEGQPSRSKVFLASRCGFAEGYFTSDLESVQGQDIDYLSSILIKKNSRGEGQ
jgi:precorrin-2/cobalt-factor-2 C20-methyltransferase